MATSSRSIGTYFLTFIIGLAIGWGINSLIGGTTVMGYTDSELKCLKKCKLDHPNDINAHTSCIIQCN